MAITVVAVATGLAVVRTDLCLYKGHSRNPSGARCRVQSGAWPVPASGSSRSVRPLLTDMSRPGGAHERSEKPVA